jgi:hypothetical protein
VLLAQVKDTRDKKAEPKPLCLEGEPIQEGIIPARVVNN